MVLTSQVTTQAGGLFFLWRDFACLNHTTNLFCSTCYFAAADLGPELFLSPAPKVKLAQGQCEILWDRGAVWSWDYGGSVFDYL